VYPPGRPRLALPSYPWQRRRYWIATPTPSTQPVVTPPAAPLAVVRPGVSDPALDLVQQQLEVMRAQLGLLTGALDAEHDGTPTLRS